MVGCGDLWKAVEGELRDAAREGRHRLPQHAIAVRRHALLLVHRTALPSHLECGCEPGGRGIGEAAKGLAACLTAAQLIGGIERREVALLGELACCRDVRGGFALAVGGGSPAGNSAAAFRSTR